jgi:hypothetical protein
MEPPLFVWEPNDLIVFDSASALQAYVEVPDADVGVAYDAVGRLLRLRVENDRVVVAAAEAVATHQADLSEALTEALQAVGRAVPSDAELSDLVRLAHATFK